MSPRDNVIDFASARSTKVRKLEPYGFVRPFELALTYLVCSSADFFGKIGVVLDPDLMSTQEGKLGIKLAQEHAQDRGCGPGSLKNVLQRGGSLVVEGKLTEQDLENFQDAMQLVEDSGGTSEEEILTELLPLMKRRGRREIMIKGLERVGKGQDLVDLKQEIDLVEMLGIINRQSSALKLDRTAFDAIQELCHSVRLQTGIPELDCELGGGPPVGTLSYVVGDPGEGKSTFLLHVAMHALRSLRNVAYATLELDSAFILARAFANLSGELESQMHELDSGARERALAKISDMRLGHFECRYFGEEATISSIKEWVEDVEQQSQCHIDVVIVDYADLLMVDRVCSRYEKGLVTARSLRQWAKTDKSNLWTASASRRKDESSSSNQGAMKTMHAVSDSIEKSRVCDLMVTLNAKIDEFSGYLEMYYYVAKFRQGRAGHSVGPLPVDFEHARMVPFDDKLLLGSTP